VYESCHIWPISCASISCIRRKKSNNKEMHAGRQAYVCMRTHEDYICELSCHFFVLGRDEWGMWCMNVSCHTWMNHFACNCVMSHVSESCHT